MGEKRQRRKETSLIIDFTCLKLHHHHGSRLSNHHDETLRMNEEGHDGDSCSLLFNDDDDDTRSLPFLSLKSTTRKSCVSLLCVCGLFSQVTCFCLFV